MVTPTSSPSAHHIAQQVRGRFVDALDGLIVELMGHIQTQLATLAQGGAAAGSLATMQLAMEAGDIFHRERQAWVAAVRAGWRDALGRGRNADPSAPSQLATLELVDDEVVERKIVASRLGNAVLDASGTEFNNLRLRMQSLERRSDLSGHDVLRPETFALELLKAWANQGLTPPMWALVHGVIQEAMIQRLADAYRDANGFLVDQGVMAEIDMKALVRRTDGGVSAAGGMGQPVPPRRQAEPGWGRAPDQDDARASSWGGRADSVLPTTGAHDIGSASEFPDVRPSALARAAQETRMLTGVTPMTRVRQRAQGVLGQLKRLLTDRVADFDPGAAGPRMSQSPTLARALAEVVTPFAVTELMDVEADGAVATLPMPNLEIAVDRVRQRASELKTKTDKPSEKAVIEIVALMFQAILAEERIPAAIRVWFARLQIPVLRLALAEPDFFASVQHPARQLIDRMGACALGFDASTVAGNRLEREIKRIVQVIEQYPETGRRVYQLVLDEFKRFLGRSLTEGGSAQHAATLAQQVEQKEALAIQYTIELRRMLASVPVPDDVREFLFRIWSEVLAMAAVRRGPQAEETLRYKQAAADLLWAVSPKTDRAERSRVVQQLSGLLQALRGGMNSLAMAEHDQDGHIKLINDAVMQAFVSRGDGLSATKLAELSHSLAGLEDVVTDDPEGDVLLDPGMIELMFGVEGDVLEVIATGGSQPSDGMLQWARELELGAWFTLDYQGDVGQVQYVWKSQRGQLHMFSAGSTRNYLVQTRRLASYLQAGLLVPVEDEALTIRATREALTRLNADPERLLH
ncbi:MAG: DUF1631 family protein [Pseudomonadota bacterium]|nr:DUF1631 family protein [Pseudomonadota bacterium]